MSENVIDHAMPGTSLPASVDRAGRRRDQARAGAARRRAARPPRRVVDPSRLAELSGAEPELSPALQEVWELARRDAVHLAERLEVLSGLWTDPDPEDLDLEARRDCAALGAALGLHLTRGQAERELRDAHVAVTHLPRTLSRLKDGAFAAGWFQHLLRRTRHLAQEEYAQVDKAASAWDLSLTTEQFRTRLSRLLARLAAQHPTPEALTPAAQRRVELLPPGEDGTGCLQITGPIPEIAAFAQELDSAARAVQARQRSALVAGDLEAIPHDIDGRVSGRAIPASLNQIRYALLRGASWDLRGVDVPAPRFRLNVTVPAMTLLGASEEPGMLEGTTPIPPQMARDLAAASTTWHRVLTDPASGAFLPLPATRYAPSPAMLEHLRLRQGSCAVPTCTRPLSWASECDHIQEYDHAHPERGGLTEIQNLHLLCWQHHQEKTAGHLDPRRLPASPRAPGATAWQAEASWRAVVVDNTDLATPAVVAELQAAWDQHRRREEARCAPPPDPGPPPF